MQRPWIWHFRQVLKVGNGHVNTSGLRAVCRSLHTALNSRQQWRLTCRDNVPGTEIWSLEQHSSAASRERLPLSGRQDGIKQPRQGEREVCALEQGSPTSEIWCLMIWGGAVKVTVSRTVMSNSAIPWTSACPAPLSLEFSRQKYWSGLPLPSPGNLPDRGIEPWFPTMQVDSLSAEP